MEIRGTAHELLVLENKCKMGAICDYCALKAFCKHADLKDIVRLVKEGEESFNRPTLKPILITKGDDENASNI